MKLLNRLFLSFCITIILFSFTVLRYNINCMGEIQQGYGHFFVWSVRGATSLSYEVDLLRLVFDFLLFFILVLGAVSFIGMDVSKRFKTIIYVVSFVTVLLLIPYFLIMQPYLGKVDCQVIYSSFSSVLL